MALRGRIFAAIFVLIILGLIVRFVLKSEAAPVIGPSPIGPSPSNVEEEEEEEEEELGPCGEYSDNTPASEVSVSCLRKTLTDLGCSTSASLYTSIADDYTGWLKTDGEDGAGTYQGIRANIESYVNSDDDAKRIECFGETE
jgi:hypothetical protein